MEDTVSHEEKVRWFQELTQEQEGIAAARCAGEVGKTLRVLVEERGKTGKLLGRTEGFVIVEFDGEDNLIGTFADVKITNAKNWILEGKKLMEDNK